MERTGQGRKGKERKGKYFLTTLRGGVYDRAAFIPRWILFISGSGSGSAFGSGSDSLWH
jgi:hypothetical protein